MDSLYLESLSPMLSWGVNCGEFLGFNVLAQWYPRVVLFWCSEGRKEGLLALQASTLPSCLHVRWSVHATACTQHCTLYRRGTSYLDIGHVVAGQYRQPSNSLSDNLFTHKFARLLAGGVIQGKFVIAIESQTIWLSFHCFCCWWIALLPTSYLFSPVCTLTLPQYLWHQLSGCTHRQKHRYELTHPLLHKTIHIDAIHTRIDQPLHAHVCLTLCEELWANCFCHCLEH